MNLFDTYFGMLILLFLLILSLLGWFHIIKGLINGTEKSVGTIVVIGIILPIITASLIVQNSTVKNYLNKYTIELTKDEKQVICSTMKDYILENYGSTTFDKKQNRDKIPAKYYSQNDIHNIFYKNGKASYELGDIQNGICLFLEERYIQDVGKIGEKDISQNLMINENFTTFDFANNLYKNKMLKEKRETILNFGLK